MDATKVPKLSGRNRVLWLTGVCARQRAALESLMRGAAQRISNHGLDREELAAASPIELYESALLAIPTMSVNKTAGAIGDALAAGWSALQALDTVLKYRWDWGRWPESDGQVLGPRWVRFIFDFDIAARMTNDTMTDEQVYEILTQSERAWVQLQAITWIVPQPGGEFFFPEVEMQMRVAQGHFDLTDTGYQVRPA